MLLRVLTMLLALALAVPMAAEPRSRLRWVCPCPVGPAGAVRGSRLQGRHDVVEELNAKGGRARRKVELIIRDSKADATSGAGRPRDDPEGQRGFSWAR